MVWACLEGGFVDVEEGIGLRGQRSKIGCLIGCWKREVGCGGLY